MPSTTSSSVSSDFASSTDHALVADLFHRIGDETTNIRDREVDAALEVHRVHAGGNSLGSFPDDRMSEHGRRSRAVTGLVGGLRGHLAHHLRAHVLELVFELDLLGDGHAVLGDAWCAKRLVEQDVATLGAKRHAYRVGERIDAMQHSVTRVDREFHFLGRHLSIPFCSTSSRGTTVERTPNDEDYRSDVFSAFEAARFTVSSRPRI